MISFHLTWWCKVLILLSSLIMETFIMHLSPLSYPFATPQMPGCGVNPKKGIIAQPNNRTVIYCWKFVQVPLPSLDMGEAYPNFCWRWYPWELRTGYRKIKIQPIICLMLICEWYAIDCSECGIFAWTLRRYQRHKRRSLDSGWLDCLLGKRSSSRIGIRANGRFYISMPKWINSFPGLP